MTVARLFAIALLAFSMAGCQALKDDPVLGDHEWQPNSSFANIKDR